MDAVMRLLSDDGATSIVRLADELGLSARQLRRRFRRAVELTPAELARLRRRHNPAVVANRSCVRWIDLAAEHGYADPAKLVRRYRRLTR